MPSNLPDAAITGIYGNHAQSFLFIAPLYKEEEQLGGEAFRERTKWLFDCMFMLGSDKVRFKKRLEGVKNV